MYLWAKAFQVGSVSSCSICRPAMRHSWLSLFTSLWMMNMRLREDMASWHMLFVHLGFQIPQFSILGVWPTRPRAKLHSSVERLYWKTSWPRIDQALGEGPYFPTGSKARVWPVLGNDAFQPCLSPGKYNVDPADQTSKMGNSRIWKPPHLEQKPPNIQSKWLFLLFVT